MKTEGVKKPWFPAKRFGWGWGFPTCWQGWLVFVGYLSLQTANAIFFAQHLDRAAAFWGVTCLLSSGFFVVCWKKGERPLWRWGGSDARNGTWGQNKTE